MNMEKENTKNMSNTEIKVYLLQLENEFEAKKNNIKKICEELIELEHEYNSAQNELNIRKTIY